jgi:hypothetical protein
MLFGPSGNRKYLSAAERLRFAEAAQRALSPDIALDRQARDDRRPSPNC